MPAYYSPSYCDGWDGAFPNLHMGHARAGKQPHLKIFRHLIRMSSGCPSLEKEAWGQTLNTLEGLHISSVLTGLEISFDPKGRAGERGRGETSGHDALLKVAPP